MLTSRFLIHLHQVERRLARSSQTALQMSEVIFGSHNHNAGNSDGFFGSMGAEPSLYQDDDDDDI